MRTIQQVIIRDKFINEKIELEEFFEHFENLFLSELKDEKGAIDFQRVFRVLTLYRTFNKGKFCL